MGGSRAAEAVLHLAFGFLYCKLSTLETDLAMCAVAERFIDGSTAATELECSFAREIILSAVDIDQFDSAFRSFYAQRAIRTDSNLDLRHAKILQPYGFLVSLKKISRKSS